LEVYEVSEGYEDYEVPKGPEGAKEPEVEDGSEKEGSRRGDAGRDGIISRRILDERGHPARET